jgi:2-polyprenyl-3-methyl-5-hydroxy-6-metoxy-1,4-benzoquinol methylase
MNDHVPYWLAERPLDEEFQRLEQQASLSDPAVRARLSILGLRPGMRVLEVGAGTGSMVRWLVEQGAAVTALDLSDKYFATYAAPQVVQQIGDVRTAELGGGYDFIVAQLLLHHLPERRDVVSRLASLLSPGGWLLVNEPDMRFMWTYSGPTGPVAWFQAMTQKLTEIGADYSCGMELPSMFRDASLENVDGGLWTSLIASGSDGLRHYLGALEILRPVVIERGWSTEADIARIAAELRDHSLTASGTPMLLCWGQRAQTTE